MPPGARLAGILIGLGVEPAAVREQLRELLALDDDELESAIAAAEPAVGVWAAPLLRPA